MKVLVLGSEGVVGKSLVKWLKINGHDVESFDIKLNDSQDLTKNIYTWDVDFIFFMAYDVGVSKYIANTANDFIDNNLKLMMNTFKSIENSNVPFIFASSQMQNMYNPYGTLKRIGEHYTNNLNGISVRFWNIYGPEEINNKSHVIPDFIHQFKTSNKIKILTDGTAESQFLYTDDCAKCLISMMNNFEKIDKKSVDISSFEWVSIYNLAKMISPNIEISDVKSDLQSKNEPDTYILKFWKPETSLTEGLRILNEC